ncbi:MAG: prepilin-type N-terminal cleavage/methylation domain-containing protein [Limisphaerales bacterium]
MKRKVRHPDAAFTLLEVMIAVAVFFVAVFAILNLVSQNLRYIQNLQKPQVDIASLAVELSLTNSLEEGIVSGDFGDVYPNASWTRDVYEAGTNGLFGADFVVTEDNGSTRVETKLSILLYRPNSEGLDNRDLGREAGRPIGRPMGQQ